MLAQRLGTSQLAGSACLVDVSLVIALNRGPVLVFCQVDWGAVPASAWGALAWAGLGTSFAAHSAVSWAVGRCSAVVPSIYSCMQVLQLSETNHSHAQQKL